MKYFHLAKKKKKKKKEKEKKNQHKIGFEPKFWHLLIIIKIDKISMSHLETLLFCFFVTL